MNDVKMLISSPEEYFTKENIRIRPFIITFLITLALQAFMSIKFMGPEIKDMLSTMGVGSNPAIALGMGIFIVVFGYIFLAIAVNIGYFIVSSCIKIFEKDVIEENNFNKSTVKKLLYISYLVPSILDNIISSLFQLLKDDNLKMLIGNINSMFIYILVSLIIYGILKYNVKTKKIHKIVPIIIYLLNIALIVMDMIQSKAVL